MLINCNINSSKWASKRSTTQRTITAKQQKHTNTYFYTLGLFSSEWNSHMMRKKFPSQYSSHEYEIIYVRYLIDIILILIWCCPVEIIAVLCMCFMQRQCEVRETGDCHKAWHSYRSWISTAHGRIRYEVMSCYEPMHVQTAGFLLIFY